MIIYGLIGYPLSHSRSGMWFAEKLRKEGRSGYSYLDFPLASLNEFPALLCRHPGLVGLNVTIPYKEQIIPWLEELDPKSESIGAVNTILIRREKGIIHLKGFNTDADGFIRSADFSGHHKALILGTGGAAKAVAYALGSRGISCKFVSRTRKSSNHLTYEELSAGTMATYTLIVNATPLGMFPCSDTFPPIPYHLLTKEHFLYDLVYNPDTTAFLKKGSDAGAQIQNGSRMLELQAELSYRIWTK